MKTRITLLVLTLTMSTAMFAQEDFCGPGSTQPPLHCTDWNGHFDRNNPYVITGYGHNVAEWQPATPDTGFCPQENSTLGSPLVIDLDGKDFADAFTDADHGVWWDFFDRGPGGEVQIAWTNPDRHIAFLALDRPPRLHHEQKPDGIINSSWELFGNRTHQPLTEAEQAWVREDAAAAATGNCQRKDPISGAATVASDCSMPTAFPANGFRALAYFDWKENGGNGDGWISPEDSIWPKLRLCQFRPPHTSFAGNCQTLDEAGIASISLKYEASSRTDQYCNQMRYQGTLTMSNPMGSTLKIYDVFFVSR